MNYEEIINNTIREIIPFLWQIFAPILIPIFVGAVVVWICKFFVRKVVYFFSVVSGDTKRETKRKLKKSDNLIDLISTVNDIRTKK